jgi:sarcosine oxidase/L-pipecolate oxidase
MNPFGQIVIVGAGVFGLTTALQLAREGHEHIVVLDRNAPPVSATPV